MLKKDNRMKTRFQFNITRNKGIAYRSRYSHLFIFNPNDYQGPPQFGIVISGKISKKAVERNRIKRLYRETIRINLDLFKDNTWVVIQPNHQSLGKNYEEISSDLIETVQKISGTH